MNRDHIDIDYFYIVCGILALCIYFLVGSVSGMNELRTEVRAAVEEREAALQIMADESNSQYNTLLEDARDAKQSVYSQCDWIQANISAGVADYCYDSANEFRDGDYTESPIDVNDFNTFEYLDGYE